MSNETIKCPKCNFEFAISQAISKDIELSVAAKYEKQLSEIKETSKKTVAAKEKEWENRLSEERAKIEEKARKTVSESVKLEMTDLKAQLDEKQKKIDESYKQELEFRKKQREMEEKEKRFELEFQKKLDAEKAKLKEDALRQAEEAHSLKDAEKEKQLADMKKQIDDLKRKAEQGSQQTQGEVLELAIEEMLRSEFPFDDVEPVSKGVRGADIIQTVKTQSGKECGKILWETKRAKAWTDSWLPKLKDDQRDAKADIAVLVSEVLPKGINNFRIIDGVWITSISSALSLALALRVVLTQVSREKQLQSGKKEKMELVYGYLTGPEFRNRLEAIVESFIKMKSDLDAEKRALEKIWAKREKQLERVVLNISGMRGDLEGIAGMALPGIGALELSAPDEVEDETTTEDGDDQ
jgi:hypothetical protein